jgi:hypothetical protein
VTTSPNGTKQKEPQNDEHGLSQSVGCTDTRRGYLGDYQYSSKLSFEREEIDLGHRSGAAAIGGLDTVVFPWTTKRKIVALRLFYKDAIALTESPAPV